MILASDFGLSYILEAVALIPIAYFIGRYVWRDGIGTFLPPLRGILDNRKAAIVAALAAGDEAKAQAAALVTTKRDALNAAKVEAERIVAQSNVTAAELVSEGERRAEEDYQRIVQRAELQVSSALAQARVEVLAEASQLIVRAVEEVIEAELDGTSHHRLIGEAITATETEAV